MRLDARKRPGWNRMPGAETGTSRMQLAYIPYNLDGTIRQGYSTKYVVTAYDLFSYYQTYLIGGAP